MNIGSITQDILNYTDKRVPNNMKNSKKKCVIRCVPLPHLPS